MMRIIFPKNEFIFSENEFINIGIKTPLVLFSPKSNDYESN